MEVNRCSGMPNLTLARCITAVVSGGGEVLQEQLSVHLQQNLSDEQGPGRQVVLTLGLPKASLRRCGSTRVDIT